MHICKMLLLYFTLKTFVHDKRLQCTSFLDSVFGHPIYIRCTLVYLKELSHEFRSGHAYSVDG